MAASQEGEVGLAYGSSWLKRILSAFGSGQSAPNWHERAANEPLSEQEQYLVEHLPFERHVVHGASALREWQRLRNGGETYPIIAGGDDSLMQLTEICEFNERDAGDILGAAADLHMPEAMAALKEREQEEAEAYLRSQGRAVESDEEYAVPVGEWPEDAPPQHGPAAAVDVLTGKPLERVNILIVPAANGFEVPAHLGYGSWNECPPAEYHVATMRSWQERYGAELVSMGGDIVEMRVKRRPETREEVMALAREQYAYCADIVDQGTNDLATLAAILMVSDWWYFWWD